MCLGGQRKRRLPTWAVADLTWTARGRAGKNENQVKEKMLGKAPAEGTIGRAAGCGGRASWTLLGLRKGKGREGDDGTQARQKQSCSRARPWLVVLTRQVFFPFSIFSPYFSQPVGTACAPVHLSQHRLGLGLGLVPRPGTWPWASRRRPLVQQDKAQLVTNNTQGRCLGTAF